VPAPDGEVFDQVHRGVCWVRDDLIATHGVGAIGADRAQSFPRAEAGSRLFASFTS